jgi:hypothetical protein
MTTTSPTSAEATAAPTLGWVLKRSLLGIAILFVFVTGTVALLHASIDEKLEASVDLEEPAPSLLKLPRTAASH